MNGKESLLTTYPDIADEWHPTKNGDIAPDQVAPKSGKKVWWLGKCGHEWEAAVSSRSKGHGCPYCNNLKAWSGYNDLATTNPELSEEWNYERNGELSPSDVLSGSHKKVWWICSKGHEWEAVLKDRATGNGCPYCSNYKAWAGYNDLATVNPKLT